MAYKIQETGLALIVKIYRIIEDLNMPKDVKKQINKVFSYL
jgi:hypothetical protein